MFWHTVSPRFTDRRENAKDKITLGFSAHILIYKFYFYYFKIFLREVAIAILCVKNG